jgi:protein TonB
MASAQGSSQMVSKPVATNVVYFAPKEPQPPPRREPARHARSSRTQPPGVPALVLPEVDAVTNATSPGNPFTHVTVDFRPSGGLPYVDTTAHATGSPTDVLTAAAVDELVRVIPGQAPPRYPLGLQRAGVAGEVVARFIVDTTGRVERGSIAIQQTTHAAFARAVQDRLGGLRFVPARTRGRAVRQLVEQRFTFELVRR